MIAAQHIKDLRIKHNYTQQYLAHELEVSQKTYSNMENGKSRITLTVLQRLSKVYDIDVIALVKQISEADVLTITNIKHQHQNLTEGEIYNGVNNGLPLELISHLKARIEDLKMLVESKNDIISTLKARINLLENKAS
ncbi:helix-turn-helix domain-containing protein [Winogradskyella sp.]|uniref:helix-turn-helix domain-containing protein n=1 Tax=Winogradskyella sp. TaxID=1883156 RepID=UPI00262D7FDC|nr:helix-turn-helix domain-containing protein [Winogradskyella sp.]